MAFPKKSSGFGQLSFLSILPSIVQTAGQIGTTIYSAGVSKDIAKIQADATLRAATINAEIQKLQIERLSALMNPTPGVTTGLTSSASVSPVSVAGLSLPSSIAGIPIMYLIGGAALLLLLRR